MGERRMWRGERIVIYGFLEYYALMLKAWIVEACPYANTFIKGNISEKMHPDTGG
jgi:hypothetical protein